MKLQYKLAPSLLAADFSCLGNEISRIENEGADYVHIDVMDGLFVPNISIGLPVIRSVRKCTDMFFDVHLMIQEPMRYIENFAEAGADGITIHAEACADIDVVIPYLDRVNMVLLMSVYPGYGGQKFIERILDKAVALRKYINDNGLDVDIEMDGGIKLANAKRVVEAGVNVLVAGTGVFKGDFKENMEGFKKIFEENS